MAKPHPKGPTKTVEVACAGCGSPLYRYRKAGKGALVKCFKERIVVDHTDAPGVCPQCGIRFARETLVRGVPALKMVGGKVSCR
ncbi:MAG: hypothetical protein AAFZ18_05375 [Myxococcota bacterium]